MAETGMSLPEAMRQAVAAYQTGQLARAAALCRAILDAKPDHVDAHHLLGVVQTGLGHWQDALASYERALAIQPGSPQILSNRAAALRLLNRFDEALASCEAALSIDPDNLAALRNRASILLDLQLHEAALASLGEVLRRKPDVVEALYDRGVALCALQRLREAVASFDKALAIRPDHAEALHRRGIALHALGRPLEALASIERALAVEPHSAPALNSRGIALQGLDRAEEALASYDRALALKADSAEALTNRGRALMALGRAEEALASHERALAISPDFVEALTERGRTLEALGRFEEALASYERAAAAGPAAVFAFSRLAMRALHLCDWARTARLGAEIAARVPAQATIVSPFALLGYSDDPVLQLQCSRSFVAKLIPAPPPLCSGTVYPHERIRIAYLSADFRQHPVGLLIPELIERHDRSRFEVIGVSFGGDDGSDARTRLAGAFDRFHDVRLQDDDAAAGLLRALEVDIAVDLMGHTLGARTGILARRAAPVQVNYLGYPATMGAEFIDYIIADPIVLPMDQQPFYSEQIVHLPECYQVNDSRRKTAPETPTRQQAGLPETGFVFCCFNGNYKITPPVFEIWMRLLGAVERSVLWLLRSNRGAEVNLRKAAAARGIEPGRLVFAAAIRPDQHLARHRLADLALDTLPYNAHSTASDALWSGLPLVTCVGKSFAGRVAASLLSAAGVPELATGSLSEYEALAGKLATHPGLLGSFRRRLEQNRATCPLFDTERYRRHIEAAYRTMWQRNRQGEAPRSFRVDAG